jgi:hypothetical protein
MYIYIYYFERPVLEESGYVVLFGSRLVADCSVLEVTKCSFQFLQQRQAKCNGCNCTVPPTS